MENVKISVFMKSESVTPFKVRNFIAQQDSIDIYNKDELNSYLIDIAGLSISQANEAMNTKGIIHSIVRQSSFDVISPENMHIEVESSNDGNGYRVIAETNITMASFAAEALSNDQAQLDAMDHDIDAGER